MFLKRLNRLRRTTAFRLILWYSGIFICSALLLFAISYLLLSSLLYHKVREDVHSKVTEYVAQYRAGGMDTLRREVALEKKSGKETAFFVRVGGPQNTTIFVDDLDQWADVNLEHLEAETANAGNQWVRLSAPDGRDTLDVETTPLDSGLVLEVGKSTKEEAALLERFRATFAGFMFPVLILGIAGGAFLAYRTMRPIRSLVHTIRSISIGQMSARVPATQNGDELDELVMLFNAMLEKIAALISGMRGSLDNVAHDLRTPMTRFRGTAEMALRSDPNLEVCREALADCMEESDGILTMLNILMDISEAETGTMKLHFERVNILALMEDAVELYRHVAEEKQVSLHLASLRELFLTADRNRMQQVLLNLVDNAIKYTPPGGTIELGAREKEHQAIIVIKDTGIGISPEEVPKIWDRLYRCDQSRSQRGLGLGLSLVKAVVQAHRGRIEVSSEPGVGSLFTLYLPTSTA